MESYLTPHHCDLVTPDGCVTELYEIDSKRKLATVLIENISPAFVGYDLDPHLVFFNLKSTLAQLGLNGIGREYVLERQHNRARVRIELQALGDLSSAMLELLPVGAYIGKLFAADERRRVRRACGGARPAVRRYRRDDGDDAIARQQLGDVRDALDVGVPVRPREPELGGDRRPDLVAVKDLDGVAPVPELGRDPACQRRLAGAGNPGQPQGVRHCVRSHQPPIMIALP